MTENDSPDKYNSERSWLDKKWREIKGYITDMYNFFLPGAVSKVHQQEATEKYWILWRDVETIFNCEVEKLGIEGTVTLPHDPKDVDGYINTLIKQIKDVVDKPPVIDKKAENSSKPTDLTDNRRTYLEQVQRTLRQVLYFYKILVMDRDRLTRREGHLNILWRDITFIRTRMLTDEIIPHEKLPYLLDYCRGEAGRLGILNNGEIQELIHEAAVELENPDSAQTSASNTRSTRNIVRILTRLHDSRLQRLHTQRINKLIYQTAFLIFLTLSSILLYNHDYVLAPIIENQEICQKIAAGKSSEKRPVTTISNEQKNVGAAIKEIDNSDKLWLPEKLIAFFDSFFELIRKLMGDNNLFFIFFSGLVGGFLSTVVRLSSQKKELLPGEDAYYAWYVLTKPVVGALGAAILYVIVRANFVPVEVFNVEFLNSIKCDPVGAKGFAFGCIMGFSERIFMPEVK